MNHSYVEHRDESYWLTGTRVSLDSIVYAFHLGQTPEGIAQMFPVLSLEQVYGAVTYYLANRAAIDAYLRKTRQDYDALRQQSVDVDPAFYQKMADARRQLQAAGP